METKINTNFTDFIREKIVSSITEKGIDAKSIYYANINKYWCSVYKTGHGYGLVIRHETRGLLYHDYLATEEAAFKAFIIALQECNVAGK